MKAVLPQTLFVSFPRTGHHYLASILRGYFQERIVYCDPYKHSKDRRARANLVKSHDFTLTKVPCPSTIVMSRAALPTLQSYFEFSVRAEGRLDTRRSWEKFAKEKFLFYRMWMFKWQALAHLRKLPFIYYGQLVEDPERVLSMLVNYLTNKTPDPELVRYAIANPVASPKVGYYHVHKRPRKVEDFKYYNPKFLKSIGLMR